VAYFAVSVDDPETNRKFAQEVEADYPILSDPEKKVATAYGVLRPNGFAARTTFYIGPDGKILEIDRTISVKTAGEDIARKLGELGVAKKR
jgi:peroxiredoxin Q/BCP